MILKTESYAQYPVVYDIDGNEYEVVTIGNQVWMRQNLKTTKFNNGEEIYDGTQYADWNTTSSVNKLAARSAYGYNYSNVDNFGYMYNNYAVTDERNIAIKGFRVPSDSDFQDLESNVGMLEGDLSITGTSSNRGTTGQIGNLLRSTSATFWDASATPTDAFGLNIQAGSIRYGDGTFEGFASGGSNTASLKRIGQIWTSTADAGDATKAYRRLFNYNATGVGRNTVIKTVGIYVRLMADAMAEIDNSAGFRMLSSPVETTLSVLLKQLWTQGATGADDESGSPNVYTWSTASQNWVAVTDLSATISAGTGVLVQVFADNDASGEADTKSRAIAVSGTINTGDVSPTLATGADEFTLIGNPYSKSLDFNSIERSNLYDVVYVWDAATENWKTYGADKLTGNGYGDLTDGLIAPFQSFFVANSTTSPSLTMSLTDTSSTAATFLGKTQSKSDFIRLQLSGNELTSSTWLVFNEEGTLTTPSKRDAFKLSSYSANFAQLATNKGNKLLDIAHFPSTELNYSIPISISASENGSFWLSATQFQVAEGTSLVFNDRIEGISIPITEDFMYLIEINQIAKHKSGNLIEGPMLASSSTELSYSITVKTGTVTSVESKDGEIPAQVYLAQNFPNPFNPSTQISFAVPTQTPVRLAVYDMLGREVAVLLDEAKVAGSYKVSFDASNLPSGVYLYRLQANGQTLSQRMTLIK